MREPGPALAPVGPEPLQTALDVRRERGRAPVEVVEDEHRDAPRLPVAGRGETQIRRGVRRGRPQLAEDGLELAGGP